MADEGWICLPNDFIEWEWYGDANTVHLFVHLLLSANQVDKRWQGVEVKRGQLVCGRKELAERLGMSEQNVRTALDHLKSSNEVTIKTYSKFSLVTLNNWDRYQQGNQQDLQETPVKQGSTSRTRKSNQQNVAEVTSKVTSKEHEDLVYVERENVIGADEGNQQSNQQPTSKVTSNQPAANHNRDQGTRDQGTRDQGPGSEGDHITPPFPPSGLPAAVVEDPKPRKAAPHAEVVQHFFDLKGWKAEGPEFRRYLRAGKDLLEVCGGDVALAREKLGKVRDWADRKELSWSLETVLKRWHEIDAPERPERKRATIDGDRAYLNERGDWMIIPRDGGPHLLYAGPLSAIRYD